MTKKRYVFSDPTANKAIANVERAWRSGGRPSRDLVHRLRIAAQRVAAGDDTFTAATTAGVSIDYVKALTPAKRG